MFGSGEKLKTFWCNSSKINSKNRWLEIIIKFLTNIEHFVYIYNWKVILKPFKLSNYFWSQTFFIYKSIFIIFLIFFIFILWYLWSFQAVEVLKSWPTAVVLSLVLIIPIFIEIMRTVCGKSSHLAAASSTSLSCLLIASRKAPSSDVP